MRVFHFGDAPQDMQAGREAGVVPMGVTTGVFTADQLISAGAEKVIPDRKDADDILQMSRSGLGIALYRATPIPCKVSELT